MVAVLVLAAAAAWSDLRTRRVPNALTLPALVAAVAVRATAGEVWDALAGAGVALLFYGLAWLLGWVGGGDVKLAAALGAVGGPLYAAGMIVWAGLAGGVMAVWTLRGWLVAAVAGALVSPRLATLASSWQLRPSGTTLPYGVAIAVGAVLALVLPGLAG